MSKVDTLLRVIEWSFLALLTFFTLLILKFSMSHTDVLDESLPSPMRTSSRLSKTLLEIVRDKDALSCLKAFLKTQNADQLLKFWCDADSFHASTLTRLRTHSLQHASKCSNHKKRVDSVRSDKKAASISYSNAASSSVDNEVKNCDHQIPLPSTLLQDRENMDDKDKSVNSVISSSNCEIIGVDVNQSQEAFLGDVNAKKGVNCDISEPSKIQTSDGFHIRTKLPDEISSQTNEELRPHSNLPNSLESVSEKNRVSLNGKELISHVSPTETAKVAGSHLPSLNEVKITPDSTSSQEDISKKLKKSKS